MFVGGLGDISECNKLLKNFIVVRKGTGTGYKHVSSISVDVSLAFLNKDFHMGTVKKDI